MPSIEDWYQTPKLPLRSPKVAAAAIWDTEAMCAATIRELETACADHTHTLEWSLEESMLDLECETIEKEGWDHQSFLEACGAALQACPMEFWGVLMYPLQLLMGNAPLAAFWLLLLNQLLQWETHPCNSSPNCDRDTCTSHGDQMMMPLIWLGGILSPIREEEAAVLDVTLGEWPHQKWKDGRPLGRLLKESHQEAFSKDTEIIKAARWAYYPSIRQMFSQEGSYDLTSIFREMARETNLLNVEIHEVWEVWAGRWELKAANNAAKASQWEIAFFCMVLPTELPNIMGLKGIHSPKALCQWGSCLFCHWCAKEGQTRALWLITYELYITT